MNLRQVTDLWTVYRRWVLSGVALTGVLVVIGWVWWASHSSPTTLSTQQFTPAKNAYNSPTIVTVKPKVPLKVLKKSEAVKKLDLPEDVAKDENKEVVTASEITSHSGDRVQAVTTLDTSTGEFKTISKELPKKFLRYENTADWAVRYGYSLERGAKVEAEVNMKMVGIGPVSVGPYVRATDYLDHHKFDVEGGVIATGELW